MLTRRSVAVCDVYQSIPPAGTLVWIGLIVRLDIWLSRIAKKPLLMLRAPLITTSHRGRAKTRDNRAGGDFRLNDVARGRRRRRDRRVAVRAREEEELPLAVTRRRRALSAALIEATDIDGSKTVTFAPNGFVGRLATGVGGEVHGVRRRGGRRNAPREQDRDHAPYEQRCTRQS